MPTKNWLIRTKSNHILGPVSKEKVIELYHNGSVRPEDEICSGNGFWFFLREKDQVEEYLLGNKKQSFNPMSEGIDVLTAPTGKGAERPDDDITMVGGINLSELKDTPATPPRPRPNGSVQVKSAVNRAPAIVAAETQEVPPSDEEPEAALVEAVARPVARVHIVASPTPITPGKGKKKAFTPAGNPPLKPLPKRAFSDRLVMVSAVVILLVLAGMLYYRKRILQEFIQSSYSTIIPEAHAQTTEFKSKKKIFLSH